MRNNAKSHKKSTAQNISQAETARFTVLQLQESGGGRGHGIKNKINLSGGDQTTQENRSSWQNEKTHVPP